MTIASFCRDELLAHGPLTLDDLARRARAADVTRALEPRGTVRSAIRNRAIELPGERWVTPMWLLEGRCLTTRSLPTDEDVYGEVDTSGQDLRLLELAAHVDPIRLVGGGRLRLRGWSARLSCDVPLPQPGPGELLCFRGVGAELEVTTVPEPATGTLDAERVRRELDAIPKPRYYDYRYDAGLRVLRRLTELVIEDDTLLRTPLPPLSTLSSELAAQVREAEERWSEPYAESWYAPPASVPLTPDRMRALELLAAREGLLPYEWVERQIDRHGPEAGFSPLRIVQ